MPNYTQANNPFAPDSIPDVQRDGGQLRYTRANFFNTGQDSFTDELAQDQTMWQALYNAMPITTGAIKRRWGLKFFGDISAAGNSYFGRSAVYQSDLTGQRNLIFSSQNEVVAVNEDGSVFVPSLFNPSASVFNPPRITTSRSYAYFSDSNDLDLKKWDGNSSGNTTKWGIATDLSTIQLNSLRPCGTGANETAGWANPGNITVEDGVFTTQSVTGIITGAHIGTALLASNFGFAIPGGATINGIKVEMKCKHSIVGSGESSFGAQLEKAGAVYGYGLGFDSTTSNVFHAMGGSNTLWGGIWTPADINSANFKVRIIPSVAFGTGTSTFSVDFVRVTVTYTTVKGVITVATGGAGAVTLTVGRIYYCVFQNSITGHLSDLNPASASTGPVTSKQIDLSTIPVSTDAQVDTKVILATADGGDPAILYFVTEIPNAVTTYTDGTDEATLVLNQQYLFTDEFGSEFGVAGNTPPPTGGNYCVKHKGRLWMASGQNLFFSKSTEELTLPNGFIAGKYEEAWPGDNFFDISEGAEIISGLLSDGNVLYVGTESHIRRIFGDDASTFQEPEILHPHTGVANQEVWKVVYVEGIPAGMIWLTPDKRVMASDGNTYMDIGHPVQDVLRQVSSINRAHAFYASDAEYDVYGLAVSTIEDPTPNILLIYDLRAKRWGQWLLGPAPVTRTDTFLFNITLDGTPQWWMVNNVSELYTFDRAQAQDQLHGDPPIDIETTVQTSWLNFELPMWRKALDDIEIIGDPDMTVTVEGATALGDFASPIAILTDAPLVNSPFGSLKIYLSSRPTKYKHYRFTFKSSTQIVEVLNAYSIRYVAYNSL